MNTKQNIENIVDNISQIIENKNNSYTKIKENISNYILKTYKKISDNIYINKNSFFIISKVNIDTNKNEKWQTYLSFKVNEKGRQKVLKEKRKNVHAYVVTDKYLKLDKIKYNLSKLAEVYYNPYTTNYFVIRKNGKKIEKAKKVLAFNNKIFM